MLTTTRLEQMLAGERSLLEGLPTSIRVCSAASEYVDALAELLERRRRGLTYFEHGIRALINPREVFASVDTIAEQPIPYPGDEYERQRILAQTVAETGVDPRITGNAGGRTTAIGGPDGTGT